MNINRYFITFKTSEKYSLENFEILENKIRSLEYFSSLDGLLIYYQKFVYLILEANENFFEKFNHALKEDSQHHFSLIRRENDIQEKLYSGFYFKYFSINANLKGGEDLDEISKRYLPLVNAIRNSYEYLKEHTSIEIIDASNQDIELKAIGQSLKHRINIFIDLFATATLVEILEIHDLSRLFEKFFRITSETIAKYDGKISRIVMDGLMIYFEEGRESKAVDACLEILSLLDILRKNSTDPLYSLIYCGIGIASGEVTDGLIGFDGRKEFTVAGRSVNLASRFEKLTRDLGHLLIFDDKVANCIHGKEKMEVVGKFKPKGLHRSFNLYSFSYNYVKIDLSKLSFEDDVIDYARG